VLYPQIEFNNSFQGIVILHPSLCCLTFKQFEGIIFYKEGVKIYFFDQLNKGRNCNYKRGFSLSSASLTWAYSGNTNTILSNERRVCNTTVSSNEISYWNTDCSKDLSVGNFLTMTYSKARLFNKD
jgi:hypothetical protein